MLGPCRGPVSRRDLISLALPQTENVSLEFPARGGFRRSGPLLSGHDLCSPELPKRPRRDPSISLHGPRTTNRSTLNRAVTDAGAKLEPEECREA